MNFYPAEVLASIVREACGRSAEQPHVEFKSNHLEPSKIGDYLSGLSNAATLARESYGFLIFGVEDGTHAIKGTTFDPDGRGKGNEDLIPWLTRLLDPQIAFAVDEVEIDGSRIVVFTVERASYRPVSFQGIEYIRVGTALEPLRQVPAQEARLWAEFRVSPFETGTALDRVPEEQVFELLDTDAYFHMTNQPVPSLVEARLDALRAEGLIRRAPGSGWQITNLGGVLFARKLSAFPTLARKATRVIQYNGRTRSAPAREQAGGLGYGIAFPGLLGYVDQLIPSVERFDGGVRVDTSVLPPKAVRELIANALIHQDFSISGSGPMIEVFDDRIEVSNPGDSLVDPLRIIDAAPQSRNETLASLMRRMGLCEERGSGWDQIAELIELNGLPAPLFNSGEGFMRVAIFMERPFAELSAEERQRAVLFHACLQYARHSRVTNSTLRTRFRLPEESNAVVSRLIRDAVAARVLRIFDGAVGAKARSYVPFFA